ncbi:putative integral membrane protein [Paenibacillus phyllosphaerae]|uniref:Putative integral membrane protein n=1 Tax=Paenibacillus phyllosphaerae TaxID=274593 RepID=A0A7W5AYF3_9BACL|nr:lipopolysaccharide assembly protein LapA domain-containing protein [Paenibacillus phyllosphaerae]MBB3111064.1 putative integral membrane protein [Paenibacillus phyllosphaerae]
MRTQWSIILSLLFALVIAIFAVVNVESVPVDYVFGHANFPLILVILGSSLLGGFAVGIFGIVRQYKLTRRIRSLEKQLSQSENASNIPPELVDDHLNP